MRSTKFGRHLGWLAYGLLGLAIIVYVLFQFPQPGVADQGDFDRVMSVSGLQLRAIDANNPDFVRFLKYTVTDYQIKDASMAELLGRLKSTSISYLITLVSLICRAFGQDTFKTGYLAIAYLLIYMGSIYIIFKHLNITNQFKLALFGLLAFLVLLDGNYLVWFNSLYGEPMMISTLMLYIAAWVYYIYQRYVLKSQKGLFIPIMLIFAAAFLFLGSKIQVISSLPIILIMLALLLWKNMHYLKRYQFWVLCLLSVLVIIYPVRLFVMNEDVNKDTQFNAVFYGILMNSANPAQDLMDMGLNPDLAVEAGKHSFLDNSEYVKYVPHSEVTRAEFYSRISNGKLISFYITHPARLLQGMEYTASQAFTTSTFLGKYPQSYSEESVWEFNRFTLWSSYREKHFPKNLWFVLTVYGAFLIVSLLTYTKRKDYPETKAWVQLGWGVMLIGLIQFPMPFIGNGQADTAKQLFLFNFIFDLVVVVAICWGLNKLIDFFNE